MGALKQYQWSVMQLINLRKCMLQYPRGTGLWFFPSMLFMVSAIIIEKLFFSSIANETPEFWFSWSCFLLQKVSCHNIIIHLMLELEGNILKSPLETPGDILPTLQSMQPSLHPPEWCVWLTSDSAQEEKHLSQKQQHFQVPGGLLSWGKHGVVCEKKLHRKENQLKCGTRR